MESKKNENQLWYGEWAWNCLSTNPVVAGRDEWSQQLLYLMTGLAGETGEVVGALTKIIYRVRECDCDFNDVLSEMGDLLWYFTNLGTFLGFTLGDIRRCNVKKLEDRFPKILKGSSFCEEAGA